MTNENDRHDGDVAHSDDGGERRYCRECGYVEPTRGYHPEYGPKPICPDCGPYGPGFFESKEAMIEYDHESALLQTDRPLRHLNTESDRDE